MDGPAPATINAVEDALGTRFNSVPLLAEDIFDAVSKESSGELLPTGGK
jgi:CO/xanthine dehydrogenase Mo-binding subunit